MDVFVSRPTKVEPNFEPGLAAFLTRLKDLGLAGHTLGATDYGSKSPLDQVIGILTKCSGAVILGYPQVRVDAGVVRGTPISAPMMLPTEWNHIEAGLAYARKLPLLVIHHVGVKRGIFDRGALNSFIFEIDLSQQAWALSPEIGGALQTWRDEVLGFKPTTEKDRGPTYSAILEGRNGLWTVQALGRRIVSPKPLEAT